MEHGKPWQHTIKKGQLYKYQRVIRFQWLASWMNVKNMSVEPGCLYRNWKLKYREDTASKLSLIRPTSKPKGRFYCCFFCFVLLATHSCFRGGPESLCSGITPNVQSESEWIRVIQRHKVQSEIFQRFFNAWENMHDNFHGDLRSPLESGTP